MNSNEILEHHSLRGGWNDFLHYEEHNQAVKTDVNFFPNDSQDIFAKTLHDRSVSPAPDSKQPESADEMNPSGSFDRESMSLLCHILKA